MVYSRRQLDGAILFEMKAGKNAFLLGSHFVKNLSDTGYAEVKRLYRKIDNVT